MSIEIQSCMSQYPVILALDLSLKSTGWAVCDLDGFRSGRQAFPLEKGRSPALRFARFTVWLAALLDAEQPDFVIYEIPICRAQGNVQDALVGLKTRVDEACAVREIALTGCYPSTLKKHATGQGNADKARMKAAAAKWAHYDAGRDPGGDEADALHLLSYAIEHIELRTDRQPQK